MANETMPTAPETAPGSGRGLLGRIDGLDLRVIGIGTGVVAFVLRVLYLALATGDRPLTSDAAQYSFLATNLAHGRLPRGTGLVFGDFMGAIEVFCIALVASLPAVLPLLLIDHPWLALRISNLLVVVLLFVSGYHWAKYVDASRWIAGLGLMGLGLALVAIAILLGG